MDDDLMLCEAVASGLGRIEYEQDMTIEEVAEWALDGERITSFVDKHHKVPFAYITAYEFIILHALLSSLTEISKKDIAKDFVSSGVGIALAVTKGVACSALCIPMGALDKCAPHSACRRGALRCSRVVFESLKVYDKGEEIKVFEDVEVLPTDNPFIAFVCTFGTEFASRFIAACKNLEDKL